jgi:hypothetical protein
MRLAGVTGDGTWIWPGICVGALNLDVFFVAKSWIPFLTPSLSARSRRAAAPRTAPHQRRRSEVRNEIRG